MKCCICGVEIKGWGNNPWPVSKKEGDECCDLCNVMYVLPARISRVYGVGSKVVPTKDAIKKVFAGDEKYFDKAAAIVEEWYNLEGAYFDDEESFLEDGYNDVAELADAATNEEERHIVWMALEGYDPYEDEEDEEEEDEEEE